MMRTPRRTLIAATVLLLAAGAVTSCKSVAGAGGVAGLTGGRFINTTPKARADVGAVTWNLDYEPTSLDPIYSANFSEDMVGANMCESLQRLSPDFRIGDGLAHATHPDPRTWVYDLKPGVRFWDGTPLTTGDVVYSMKRNYDAKLAGFWASAYRNVTSISATGREQVTVKLKQPDALFNRFMSIQPGEIVQKKYAQAKGRGYGTPDGGVMCTGPLKFAKWNTGDSIVLTRNTAYWNPAHRAHAKTFTFRFIADPNTVVNAMLSGQIDGQYNPPTAAIPRLQGSTAGRFYVGKTLVQFDLIPTARTGPIADKRIRRALSLAIDRDSIAKNVFFGSASPSRTLVTDATYGYAHGTWQKALNQVPAQNLDLAKARQLVKQAGGVKRPIVLAYPAGETFWQQITQAVVSAGKQIGLPIRMVSRPNQTYSNVFFDAKARKGLDLIETTWDTDFPDPLDKYTNFVPNFSIYNFTGYSNPAVTKPLLKAQAAEDPAEEARLVAGAQKTIMDEQLWIPVVDMGNTLFMGTRITGAPAAFVDEHYPWAADVGAS
jgi:peptide/nickel transport system substrate-binding protein